MRLVGKKKLEEIRLKLREKGLDAALFVNNEPVSDSNISYLSGFTGMLNGALLLSHETVKLITTDLDYDRAQEQAQADEILRCKNSLQLFQLVKKHCSEHRKVGVVKSKFTLEMVERIKLKPPGLTDISSLMERVRMIKDPKEIDIIRKSTAICNKGVKFLEGILREGIKENEVSGELDRMLKISGSEYPPFETIVTSGKRSAFIHPSPPASDNVIGRGMGLVDFGAVHRDYSADITVPFLIGKPDESQGKMIETVLSVWEKIRKKVKHGVKTGTLHNIYQNALKASGFRLKHSLGHSVGIDVHEYPSVSGSELELKEGMIMAIEPGVYDRKVGGCRLENTILVKKNGCELLTKSKLIRM